MEPDGRPLLTAVFQRTTSVPGFEKLRRAYLNGDQAEKLFKRVYWTVLAQDQDVTEGDPSVWPAPSLGRRLLGSNIQAWRYEDRISINNDGNTENILIWQGFGADQIGDAGACGDRLPTGLKDRPYRAGQLAFVLNADGQSIDVAQTRRLFADPHGQVIDERLGQRLFIPLAATESVLKFRDRYYIAGFLGRDGPDLEGSRPEAQALESHLAVFVRQHDKTAKVCEYRMTQGR